MKIRFASATLERCFHDESYAARCWGAELASQYTYVVNFLACIDAPGDLVRFAFLDPVASADTARGHRWTVYLVDQWCLVLEPADGEDAIGVTEVVRS